MTKQEQEVLVEAIAKALEKNCTRGQRANVLMDIKKELPSEWDMRFDLLKRMAKMYTAE